jgi:hypothetical protein
VRRPLDVILFGDGLNEHAAQDCDVTTPRTDSETKRARGVQRQNNGVDCGSRGSGIGSCA